MSKVEEPVIMVTDDGAISWTPLREGNEDHTENEASIVNGGWLLGPTNRVNDVKYVLNIDFGPEYVPVVWSTYMFSPNRDQVADVVAAMYDAAHGRGILNDKGWEILHEAMPELNDPENYKPGVVY